MYIPFHLINIAVTIIHEIPRSRKGKHPGILDKTKLYDTLDSRKRGSRQKKRKSRPGMLPMPE